MSNAKITARKFPAHCKFSGVAKCLVLCCPLGLAFEDGYLYGCVPDSNLVELFAEI